MSKFRVARHEVTQPLDKPYRFIPLTQGQNAIVDVRDFEFLSQWNWFSHWNPHTKSFYARRRDWPGHKAMHKEILGCMCDHKNHDTLDNRRKNLSKCTQAQNAKNRRKLFRSSAGLIKGVTWAKDRNKWRAQIEITVNRKRKNMQLGQFDSLDEARKAYDKGARRFHGDFACPNPLTIHSL